jgi:HSP20 family protein
MMTMRDLIPWGRNRNLPAARETRQAGPFGAVHREMNRLFDDFFDGFNWRSGMPSLWSLGWPQVEVSDGDNEVRIVAELPGLEEKDVELTLQDGTLTIRGEKKAESNGAAYSERWHGRFSRSLELGTDIDPDKVKAEFKNGVLTVTAAKLPEAQRRVKRIPVNA